MIRGLFINNVKAKDSIFESGYMVYQCLKQSSKFTLDYQEIDINNRKIMLGYDFYFFNYHPLTMSWLETRSFKKELGFVITMILEVAPNDPFVMCPENDFNFYCALDPTINFKKGNVYAFPRPLEKIDFDLPIIKNDLPIIGTFGFSTKGKGFQHVVEAVNKEFDEAIVRVNIPYGDFVHDSEQYAHFLGERCKQIAKPGIQVQVTHDFMTKEELIKWCASNTLNCFLYDRNMPGLSATTDQAIISRRPLSVSLNDTFRHIAEYLPNYPTYSLKDSIEKSTPQVLQMIEDWNPLNFLKKFEQTLMLYETQLGVLGKSADFYILPIRKHNIYSFLQHRVKKYRKKLKKNSFFTFFKSKGQNEVI